MSFMDNTQNRLANERLSGATIHDKRRHGLCFCFGRVFGFMPIKLHTGCSALYTSDVTIHDLSHPNCSTKPAWRETEGCLVQLCLIVHVSLMSIKFDDFWT